MDTLNILGILAGAATTGSFVPQAYKVYKTKKTEDLSMSMFSIFIVGLALWLIYGIFSHSLPVILANSVTLVLSVYILIMKIKHG